MRFPPWSEPPLPPLDGGGSGSNGPLPPRWFTVWEAIHMNEREWQRYYDVLMVYLMSQDTSWWYRILEMRARVAGDRGWGGELDGRDGGGRRP